MKHRHREKVTTITLDGENKCHECEDCPLERLQVALIGGLDRLEERYRHAIENLGAELLFHTGQCAGAGAERLRHMASNADIVVFITSVNSHNALQVVKAVCRKSGKHLIIMRETGTNRISHCLRDQIKQTING